ncbi:tyrosine-type recombinase/integrase [Bifidobacterium primatium]|uniref:tyrosine-type recombinase/integrase n=1 Tax=Bifidobacterium primatium TaxID=2045438 RepID=UPI0013FD8E8E|nr:site-specific integrase [Bifidobacterium primatium]
MAQNMTHPERAKVPEEFRTVEFGKGARWTVYWNADGKRKKRNFSEYRLAEEFKASVEDDIRSGRYINPDNLERTFKQIADSWSSGLTGTVKGATEGRYLRELRIWVLPRWGRVPLGRITSTSIQAWVAQLVKGTAPRNGKIGEPRPLAPKSIRSIVKVVFKGCLDYAVKAGWMQSNPVNDVKIPKQTVSVPRVYLTPEEIHAIASEMNVPDRSMVYLLAYTGVRIGEAVALRCGDVDFDAATISITRTQSVDAEGHAIETTPKNGRSRTVPFPTKLKPMLMALTERQGDDDYLFRAPRGGRHIVNNWRSRIWRHALQAAGLDGVRGLSIHSLRHSYASIAIRNGCDVKTLQNVMGHASAAETLDTYADLWPNRASEIAGAINDDVLL